MALGYQGMILLNNKLFLVLSGSLNHTRPEIASQGTYAVSNLSNAVGNVHVFDFDDINGSFSCETNFELIDELFDKDNGWIAKRDTALPFLWYSNVENKYEFGDAYWTKISLSADSGAISSTSIDIVLIPGKTPDSLNPTRYELPIKELQLNNNYIGQRFGLATDIPNLPKNVSFGDENNKQPIPYWGTSIEFVDPISDKVEVLNWSLDITNNISKRNLCSCVSRSERHSGPSLIQVGLASVSFNTSFVTVIPDSTNDVLPSSFEKVFINIKHKDITKKISLGRIDGSLAENDYNKPVQSTSDSTSISGGDSIQEMSFAANGYFTMPHIVS
jgi:hypothetical protein